ncbi:hypothetical protein MRX96_016446 [Rhipicephalus microplus]
MLLCAYVLIRRLNGLKRNAEKMPQCVPQRTSFVLPCQLTRGPPASQSHFLEANVCTGEASPALSSVDLEILAPKSARTSEGRKWHTEADVMSPPRFDVASTPCRRFLGGGHPALP